VTRVPNALVVDAFEALQNGNSGAYKRVPAALDAGFVFASGTYTSQSARRKVATTIGGRRVLQDTNNSSNDFDIITPPTPRGFGTP
jgi:archaellum component FlaF (FlaF/FlaG flagellin family)